jgi:hypothetical protein
MSRLSIDVVQEKVEWAKPNKGQKWNGKDGQASWGYEQL